MRRGPLRILAISGSLRAASTNAAVLDAAGLLASPGLDVVRFDGLGALPLFNPDLDGETPPGAVVRLRQAVGLCDALLISSPEYARGIAGAMKNALDWLVSGAEIPGKPVAIVNASQRATHADASLRLVLATMAARLVPEASITLPLLGRGLDAQGIAADPDLSGRLRAALDALRAAADPGRPSPATLPEPSE